MGLVRFREFVSPMEIARLALGDDLAAHMQPDGAGRAADDNQGGESGRQAHHQLGAEAR
jgi:hypothetical protein